MSKVLRILAFLLVAAVVVVAIVVAVRPQPVPVDVAIVRTGPMSVTVDEEGRTRIRERYVVSSPLIGRLRRITLKPGDAVRAQQTALAVIEPADPELLDARALAEAAARVRAAEAAVRQAEAASDRLQVAYDFAESDLGRVTAAFTNQAANERELDDARTNERAAIVDLRAAEFGREIATHELDVARSALLYARGEPEATERTRMSLFSPINGAVLRVFQESVAVVTPGTPLIEVGDPRDLELVIDVLSTDAVSIVAGQRIHIEHWGGPLPLDGMVRRVEPSAFTKTSALGIEEQRVNVIGDFVTPAEQRATLGDGFRIEARIVVWTGRDVLQIPTSAAFRNGGDWAVFVVNENVVEIRVVEPGHANGQTTEVRRGLVAGDRVVMHPGDTLASGVRVVVRSGSGDD